MIRFDTLRRIEGGLLSIAGLIHIVFLTFSVDRSVTEFGLYWGAMGFGIAYTLLGMLILLRHLVVLKPALVLNVVGLISVLVMFEQSPLRAIDPLLIAIDCVSVPTLIYLNIQRKSQAESVG